MNASDPRVDLLREDVDNWFEVAKFLDGHRTKIFAKYTTHPWLTSFLPPRKTAAQFQDARREFDVNPSLMYETLQLFTTDLRTQEIAIMMCKSSDCPATFLQICKEIVQRFDEEKETMNSGPPLTLHPRQTTEVIGIVVEHYHTYQPFGAYSSSPSRMRILGRVFDEKIKDGNKYVGSINKRLRALYEEGNFRNQGLVELPRVSELFTGARENIIRFAELVSGQQNLRIEACIATLKKVGATKTQQFDPVYAEMQRLRDIVERQNQVITSLEYRRLLENLPNKVYYDTHLGLVQNQKSATRYWQEAWKDLVKNEIDLLIQVTNEPNVAPGGTGQAGGAQPAPRTNITSKRPLTELFEFDFQRWFRTWSRKNPKSPVTSVPEADFKTWSGYSRGEQLYSELSGIIHQYDRSSGAPYDFKVTNWSRSDQLILSALRPDEANVLMNNSGVVDTVWDQERTRQGLP